MGAVFAATDKEYDVFHPKPLDDYCGKKLSTAMKFFCQPQVQELINSGFTGPFDSEMVPRLIDDKKRHNQISRSKRGIIEECCRKPCTLSALVKYCPIK